jgi:1-acyl-sn-glycerol-3-phosphate acyltransferase
MSEEYLIYSGRRPIRTILEWLIHIAFAAITEFKVFGRENVPEKGSLLIVSNHFSFIDPVATINAIPRPLEFVGGAQLPNAPVIVRFIPRLWGTYKVYRGTSSRDALQAAADILSMGGAVCISPEAGSWATVLRPPRPGAALIAARSGTPILPVGLDGLTDVFPFLRRGKRARVTVRIGKPFGPFKHEAKSRADRKRLDEIGHIMMQKIAELIPPERRGFYSKDEKIREAAKGTEIYPWENMQET